MAECDVIVPIRDSLSDTIDLLQSLTHFSVHRTYLIDDCSAGHVAERLRQWCADHSGALYFRNDKPAGLVGSVNRGLDASKARFRCVLVPGALLPAHALDRLVEHFRDPSVGLVTPFCLKGRGLADKLLPGLTIHSMAELMAHYVHVSPLIDVRFVCPKCFLIRGSIIEKAGDAQEKGQFMRSMEEYLRFMLESSGLRVVLSPHTLVYARNCTTPSHAGPQQHGLLSADPGNTCGLVAVRALDEIVCGMLDSVAGISGALAGNLPQDPNELRAKSAVDSASYQLPTGSEPAGVIFGDMSAVYSLHMSRFAGTTNPSRDVNDSGNKGRLRPVWKHKAMSIVFLVWDFSVSGGVTSIVQLANQFILEGHECVLVSLNRNRECPYADRLLTRPIFYASEAELAANFPYADIVVSTFWPTAAKWYPLLSKLYEFVPVYFIQDFEPYFYASHDIRYRECLLTYRIPMTRIVKSQWLANQLSEVGAESVKISFGLDLEVFYPRIAGPKSGQVITAMTRPQSPQRGFENLISACRLIHEEDPTVKFRFFGCGPEHFRGLDFPVEVLGIITEPNAMAEHLSRCDLFLEPSTYQAFGRTTLEAMACGVATVITGRGGVEEYGRHETNCLMVPPCNPIALALGALRVLRNPGLREKLIQKGLETASQFSHRIEARRHLLLYERLLAGGHSRRGRARHS